MKIVLLRPPTVFSAAEIRPGASPPLGLAYVAASLIQAGHTVVVIDTVGEALERFCEVEGIPGARRQGLSDDEVLERVPLDADAVGLSCMFSTEWLLSRALITKVRARLPEAIIIAGGEHISACPEYVLENCPAIDFCGLGEGDELIVDFMRCMETGGDFKKVHGLVYRGADGKPVRSPVRKRIRELEQIPWPAWETLPIRNYIDAGAMPGVNIGRSIPLLASRGCPYKCTFCSNPEMWGTTWKARKPEEVLREMKHYIAEYQVSNFDFFDLTAIVEKRWIVKMAQLIIDARLNITWQLPSGTRSEAIDEEVADLLYRSGCRHIVYAPESGSTFILDKIKKLIRKDSMLRSVRGAVKTGIKTKSNFIVGFPDEKIRHVLSSYGFALQLAWVGMNDVSFFPFSAYPGSELFARLRREGSIELNDEHFISLISNPGCYSNHIPAKLLPVLAYFGMGIFYMLSFMLRPHRIVPLLRAILSGKPQTRLDAALIRVMNSKRTHARRRRQEEPVIARS
ncbi:MAG TPA: radical SAM protein [Pyrinomonadaceae bacterium]|jgi:radical SAM superfamily enzyme YgiQ (UPF0313 family)